MTVPLGSHCRRRVLVSDTPLLVCRQPHVNLMSMRVTQTGKFDGAVRTIQ